MKGGGRRPEQVAEALRAVIADALVREVRDPRVGLVTVTGVQVTPELAVARVRVAVPGEEEQKRQALEGLRSAAGFLRSRDNTFKNTITLALTLTAPAVVTRRAGTPPRHRPRRSHPSGANAASAPPARSLPDPPASARVPR